MLNSATTDDGVYEVYALRYASMPERRSLENFLVRDGIHDGPMALEFYIWIVRNAHRTILVDTGFGREAFAGQRPWTLIIDPIESLVQLGIDVETIQDVVITHLHCDHAGSIDRLPNARLHVQDAEVNYATGRCMCESHLRYGFELENILTLMRRVYSERVCFHDGDASPFPGVSLHLVPGHTPGMQVVRVMTKRGPVVLASDASHYYANYLRRAPFKLTTDAIATLRSYNRLLELADGAVSRIVPGHDPKVRALYPKQEAGGIELICLHEEPVHHDLEALSRVDNF
ncbi:N-acyl homoserine lactonase family protein [Variovorax saccharolyticus]|uniref:N-acyl homoserine lactonase family protein n=1 Tax=Variovorax saccharolyticus TaxID=3053516 RepID=UPI0025760164|nr:N-acyl homoserine lactonase family protein [Variovorax sp. J22R187]MDM0021833.1 N-acyl homoserine lactonase family protein [Variovorax sp. J22R187]